jgi:hypothetical protein
MKTQTHYTTPIATVPWMRRNTVAALAMALALAAGVGLMFALGRFGQPSYPVTGDTATSPARPLIAFCRECADEVLGAAQASQGSLTFRTADSAVRQSIAPRVFRDEMLGADQANLAFLSINAAQRSSAARVSAAPLAHQPVAGPRAFRDEVLGADQANLASLSAPGSALDQQDDQRRAGPR